MVPCSGWYHCHHWETGRVWTGAGGRETDSGAARSHHGYKKQQQYENMHYYDFSRLQLQEPTASLLVVPMLSISIPNIQWLPSVSNWFLPVGLFSVTSDVNRKCHYLIMYVNTHPYTNTVPDFKFGVSVNCQCLTESKNISAYSNTVPELLEVTHLAVLSASMVCWSCLRRKDWRDGKREKNSVPVILGRKQINNTFN